MTNTMKLRHATAPAQAQIIGDIRHLLTSRTEDEVPGDGIDRVNYRLEIVLASYDDDDPEVPGQPVTDLLADVLHLCEEKGWNIHLLMAKAAHTMREERRDWGMLELDETPC